MECNTLLPMTKWDERIHGGKARFLLQQAEIIMPINRQHVKQKVLSDDESSNVAVICKISSEFLLLQKDFQTAF